jgi:hypothetical protein
VTDVLADFDELFISLVGEQEPILREPQIAASCGKPLLGTASILCLKSRAR